MLGRPSGITLLVAVFVTAGLVGIASFGTNGVAFVSNIGLISPLWMLVSLVWSCVYFVAAVLMWRRSRLAASGLLAAIGLMVFVLWGTLPAHHLLLLPLFGVTFPFAFLGYRYLHRTCEPAV